MALFMGPLRYRGMFAFFRPPSCKSGWTCWFRLTVVRSAVSRGVECVCLQSCSLLAVFKLTPDREAVVLDIGRRRREYMYQVHSVGAIGIVPS